MRAVLARVLRSPWLPAALIVAALALFSTLASRAKGDLRLVSSEIDADLKRTPPGAVAAGAVDPSKQARLAVQIAGVRSAAGQVSVALFERGPLTDGAGILTSKAVPAAGGDLAVTFDDVPQGVYAVIVFHDENGNGRIDTTGGGGPPTEGVGHSNAHGRPMGPPTWDDARFVLDRDALEVKVRVYYY